MSLSFVIHANNSSGSQRLEIERYSDGTYQFTLAGMHDGQPLQIDFDTISQRDMDDLVTFISIRSSQPAIDEVAE
ncbi:hypothetical protein ACVTMO_16910 [Pseudomonas segetis]